MPNVFVKTTTEKINANAIKKYFFLSYFLPIFKDPL